jgi:hypothetical protein
VRALAYAATWPIATGKFKRNRAGRRKPAGEISLWVESASAGQLNSLKTLSG